ncbi:hypothetical protein AAFC00_004873 [Neodothiora populina]|uniref:UspA domain-containing protein n=1 Tax=Neodothiora populina TaxID=2781224 RepID=A0ABR3P3M3_9PEZI
MATPNPRLGTAAHGDSLLSALEADAREHRESFSGRRLSTSTIAPPPAPTVHKGPPTSLFDALEDDARELRAEAASTPRRSSISLSHPSASASPTTTRKPNAMASVFGKAKIALPGDLGPSDPRRAALEKDNASVKSRNSARSLSPRGAAQRKSVTERRRMSNAEGKVGQLAQSTSEAPDGGVRLRKDYDAESGSSDEDDDEDDDNDSGADTDRSNDRGRGRARVGKSVGLADESEEDLPVRGRQGSTSTDNSAAADPKITVTPPLAATAHSTHKSERDDVHPSTAFDAVPSGTSTPVHSDDEEHLSDLRRAQRLSLTISPIHSTPSAHRVIRQVIRGDYTHFQREAEEGRRRQRVYLVATDLSSEAEYALEWTIGTVLRDGDTLLAVYAVDEEGGNVGGSEGVEIGHGADVVAETASIVRSLTAENVTQGAVSQDGSTARVAYGEREGMSKAERERFRAAEDISQRCVRLLRKTRLQVRVVVEVFHCKSPRHMITEVIDFLSPTLTILGSRGRSALKGVLLGSFSNYLVTKSSVPVMVARKRLRKHSKQRLHKDGLPIAGTGDGRMRYGRMSNVLEAPGGPGKRGNRLIGAKVD